MRRPTRFHHHGSHPIAHDNQPEEGKGVLTLTEANLPLQRNAAPFVRLREGGPPGAAAAELFVRPQRFSMLLRFCTLCRDSESHSPKGVFQAAIELSDDGKLEAYEERWLERELGWLRMHLPSPDCLRDDGNERAICWFKPGAKDAIDKVRGIVAMLEAHGIPVETVTTADAGTIIYEDKWQVVAKPRRKRVVRRRGRTRRCT